MVVEAGHGADGAPGRARAHRCAVYRLLDELRERHPELEIESCAGGGGRIDLGILERTDRVWASDCIDALERQQIQRYTQLLLPPELIGTHVGSPTAHTTHRTLNLGLPCGNGDLGSHGHRVGPDQGLRRTTGPRLPHGSRCTRNCGRCCIPARSWSPTIRTRRSGCNGVVAAGRSDAVFGIVTVDRSTTWPPGRVRLPGLDPDRRYRALSAVTRPTSTRRRTRCRNGGARGSGCPAGCWPRSGVQIPAMFPEYLHLIRATAEAEGP